MKMSKNQVNGGDVGIAPYTFTENRKNVGADAYISPFLII